MVFCQVPGSVQTISKEIALSTCDADQVVSPVWQD